MQQSGYSEDLSEHFSRIVLHIAEHSALLHLVLQQLEIPLKIVIALSVMGNYPVARRKSQQVFYKFIVSSLNILRYIAACIGLLTRSAFGERIQKTLYKSTSRKLRICHSLPELLRLSHYPHCEQWTVKGNAVACPSENAVR